MIIPIAIIGVGKIARDQHLPTIAAGARFRLAGVVSQSAGDLGVSMTDTVSALKAQVPELAAVAICTPPIGRVALVREALDLGLHVLVEKPPAATLGEAEQFAEAARAAGRTLYLTWHSREAPAVARLRDWLATRTLRYARVDWLEDVRVWHPGQEWIWTAGIGVFDPGINALSILTRVLPQPVIVGEAVLDFPQNRAAPIAAQLALASGDAPIDVRFSFDQRGPQTWSMRFETDGGTAEIADGGARLTIDGALVDLPRHTEYAGLYDRFARLIEAGGIDADLSPFRVVADAFMVGRRVEVAAFDWAS